MDGGTKLNNGRQGNFAIFS